MEKKSHIIIMRNVGMDSIVECTGRDHSKVIKISSVFWALLLFVLTSILFAQDNYVFGPSILVNDDPPGTHYHATTQRSIACQDDTLFLVWRDDRYGNASWYNSRVFFSKSTNAGNTWLPNLMISQDDDTLWGYLPHVALDSYGNIYCAYNVVNPNTWNRDICFVKSTDGGISFTVPIIVNDSVVIMWQGNCALAVDSSGQNVYIVWEDRRNEYDEDIYMAHSSDGGLSFNAAVRLNDDIGSYSQWYPVVACDISGQFVYAAWMDGRDGIVHGWDVYFARSTDYGQTFETNYPVNDTATTGNTVQGYPSMYYQNGIIYAVWRDERDDYSVYFAKSTDGGVTFGSNIRVPDDVDAVGAYPSVTADESSHVYIVWEDHRDLGTYMMDIYFSFSKDSGLTFEENVLVNDHLGVPSAWDMYPSVCVNNNGDVFVCWDSDRNDPYGNRDIFFASGMYVGVMENTESQYATSFYCFPNPFRFRLNIQLNFSTDRRGGDYNDGKGDIIICDVGGRIVKTIALSASSKLLFSSIVWDGTDNYGDVVPTGVYFLQLQYDHFCSAKKVIKIK